MRKCFGLSVIGAIFGALALTAPVFAASQTVTLSLPTMDCAACPITVKKALQRVAGVEKATVTLEPKEAVVTFDDTKVTVEALRAATLNAGYPSVLKSAE